MLTMAHHRRLIQVFGEEIGATLGPCDLSIRQLLPRRCLLYPEIMGVYAPHFAQALPVDDT